MHDLWHHHHQRSTLRGEQSIMRVCTDEPQLSQALWDIMTRECNCDHNPVTPPLSFMTMTCTCKDGRLAFRRPPTIAPQRCACHLCH